MLLVFEILLVWGNIKGQKRLRSCNVCWMMLTDCESKTCLRIKAQTKGICEPDSTVFHFKNYFKNQYFCNISVIFFSTILQINVC